MPCIGSERVLSPSGKVREILESTGTWDRFQRLRKGEALDDLLAESNKKRLILSDQRTLPPSPVKSHAELPPEKQDEVNPIPDPEPSVKPESEPVLEVESEPALEAESEPVPEPEPVANPIPDPPPVPEATLTPAKDKLPLPPADVVTDEPIDKAPEDKGLLYGELSRPGATELSEDRYPPEPVPDPAFRANRIRNALREARRSEKPVEERQQEIFSKRWEPKEGSTRRIPETGVPWAMPSLRRCLPQARRRTIL